MEEEKDREHMLVTHEQILKQQGKDIEELKDTTYGLPQIIKGIETTITRLSDNIEKFLDNAEKKYQTREVCEVCREDLNKKVEKLESEQGRMKWGLIGLLFAVIGQLVSTYMLNK